MSGVALVGVAFGSLELAVLLAVAGWCAFCTLHDRRVSRQARQQPEQPVWAGELVRLTWAGDIPIYRVEQGDELAVALWLHHARDEGMVRNAC